MKRVFALALALNCLAACAPGPTGARGPAGAHDPAGAHVPTGAQSSLGDHGLWIGPIQACRDTAESAVAGTEEHSALSNLIVTLKPDQRARLQQETERLVGSPMPIRLDGRVISEPLVREPITGGMLALAGLSREDAEAIQAAIHRPC